MLFGSVLFEGDGETSRKRQMHRFAVRFAEDSIRRKIRHYLCIFHQRHRGIGRGVGRERYQGATVPRKFNIRPTNEDPLEVAVGRNPSGRCYRCFWHVSTKYGPL